MFMTKLDAYKVLGYNYISKDEMDEMGNIRIQIWYYKPRLVLIDEIYYAWGVSDEEWRLKNIHLHSDIKDSKEFSYISEGECVELSHFNFQLNINHVYDALRRLDFKYLVRDEKGLLFAFKYKPVRDNGYTDESGYVKGSWVKSKRDKEMYSCLPVLNDMFNFITWETGVYKIN